jgi:hypothetical protein
MGRRWRGGVKPGKEGEEGREERGEEARMGSVVRHRHWPPPLPDQRRRRPTSLAGEALRGEKVVALESPGRTMREL